MMILKNLTLLNIGHLSYKESLQKGIIFVVFFDFSAGKDAFLTLERKNSDAESHKVSVFLLNGSLIAQNSIQQIGMRLLYILVTAKCLFCNVRVLD